MVRNPAEQGYTRREVLIIGAKFLGAVAFLTACDNNPIPQSIPTAPAPQQPQPLETPMPIGDALLRNEVSRLGINRSDKERLLWQTFGTKPQTEPKDLYNIPIEDAK